VGERLEIKDLSTLQPYLQLPHGGRPGSLNRRERGREREALGGGVRVYGEGRRDIRDLAGKVKEGQEIKNEKFIRINPDSLIQTVWKKLKKI
jgi:hypothetical protein